MTGVYGKYHIERVDGKPMKPGFRFVLSPEHDNAALEAIKTYAKTTDNKALDDDLMRVVSDLEES